MKVIIFVFCVSIFFNSAQADCDPNKPKYKLENLREKLLCGYDKTTRPRETNQNQTLVRLMFIPKYIDFVVTKSSIINRLAGVEWGYTLELDDSKDVVHLSTFIYMAWKDPNFKWKLSDFNFNSTELNAEDLWVPDFQILNSKLIGKYLDTEGQPTLLVGHDGFIHYFLNSLLRVHCTAQWVNWPFDTHVCNFSVISEAYYGHELDLYSKHIDVIMGEYAHSHEWRLLNYQTLRDVDYFLENDTNKEYNIILTLRMTIQRHSAILVATFIGPAIALAVISLALLYIEPTHYDRLTIISLLIAVQCLYLQNMTDRTPSNGDKTPKIVKFIASNLFLTAVLLIETIAVGSMPKLTSNPTWVHTVTNVVSSNTVLNLLLCVKTSKKSVDPTDPSNEASSVLASDNNLKQWKMFGTIIERLTFYLILIFYILFIVFCFIL